jgi:hypothetical protein
LRALGTPFGKKRTTLLTENTWVAMRVDSA